MSDSENQLMKDLRKHTREKFVKWISDTFELFEVADLGETAAANVMLDELMRNVAIFAAMTSVDELVIASMVANGIRREREMVKRGTAKANSKQRQGGGKKW